jgi:Raf kinase inhibitor-like YbhB/YbcL family protein
MGHAARLLAALVLAAAGLDARQQNPPQNPQTPVPPPGAQRGGGRGRGQIATMTLTSAAWLDGGQIPVANSQAGGEASPALTWSNVPDGIASFVLIVHDIDAPVNPGTDDALHWMVWNIPGAARALPERVPAGANLPDGSRQISATGHSYRGPASSAANSVHHLVFELYALDAMLEVPAVGASPAQTRAAVIAAMAGHVRAKGVYTGVMKRAQ